VPTGKPGRYRYYYTVAGGHGVGHDSEFQVGAAFRLKDHGQEGHFHVVRKEPDGSLVIRHDETGRESVVGAATLSLMLRAEHAEAINAHRARLKSDLTQVSKTGSTKQRERLKAEAAKYGEEDRLLGAPDRERRISPKVPAPALAPAAPVPASPRSGGITASGNTFAAKDDLRAAGFRWDGASKTWKHDGKLTMREKANMDQLMYRLKKLGVRFD
jgi:hypothetical protein